MAKHKNNNSKPKTTALDDYKNLVDGFVRIRPDVCAIWVKDKRPWPDLPENTAINDFVGSLTDGQREVLAALLQHARDGGIHDTLVFITDEINLRGLRLVQNGRELPVEPFDTLYYDWTCRRGGDPWPDEQA